MKNEKKYTCTSVKNLSITLPEESYALAEDFLKPFIAPSNGTNITIFLDAFEKFPEFILAGLLPYVKTLLQFPENSKAQDTIFLLICKYLNERDILMDDDLDRKINDMIETIEAT